MRRRKTEEIQKVGVITRPTKEDVKPRRIEDLMPGDKVMMSTPYGPSGWLLPWQYLGRIDKEVLRFARRNDSPMFINALYPPIQDLKVDRSQIKEIRDTDVNHRYLPLEIKDHVHITWEFGSNIYKELAAQLPVRERGD